MALFEFGKKSIEWLKRKGFTNPEIEKLQEIMTSMYKQTGKVEHPVIRLPRRASVKISALAFLLDSITDADGMPLCYEKECLEIPEEAKAFYEGELGLGELEEIVGKMQKVKFREHSDARRRGAKY